MSWKCQVFTDFFDCSSRAEWLLLSVYPLWFFSHRAHLMFGCFWQDSGWMFVYSSDKKFISDWTNFLHRHRSRRIWFEVAEAVQRGGEDLTMKDWSPGSECFGQTRLVYTEIAARSRSREGSGAGRGDADQRGVRGGHGWRDGAREEGTGLCCRSL